MVITSDSKCPKCGGTLKYYDRVKRLVRTKGGIGSWITLKRLRCTKCNRLQRLLPKFIFPHKQYSAEIIQAVVNGDITSDTLGFEDYPCETTMFRWSREKQSPL